MREWRRASSQKLAKILLLLNRSSTFSSSTQPHVIVVISFSIYKMIILQDYYEIVEEGTDGVEDEY